MLHPESKVGFNNAGAIQDVGPRPSPLVQAARLMRSVSTRDSPVGDEVHVVVKRG